MHVKVELNVWQQNKTQIAEQKAAYYEQNKTQIAEVQAAYKKKNKTRS